MIVVVEEDENGNLLIPLPDELTTGINPWMENDVIIWSDNGDGSVLIRNESWELRQNAKS